MAKLTDVRVATLQGFFDSGDQPTEAQFDQLILWIQEGIEEHQHDNTGDGDGTDDIGPLGVKLTFDNNADAAFSAIDIDGGLTAAQTREIRFLDRGVAEWNIQITPTNQLNIREAGVGNWVTILPGGNFGIRTQVAGQSLQIGDVGVAGTRYIRVYNSTYGWDFGCQAGGNFRINRIAGADTPLEITSATGAIKFSNLAGVGARAVIAAADGTLSAP